MDREKQFGSRLRQVRIEAGLSASQLAKRVGISISYISKIENGVIPAPSTITISKIASILNADINELLILANKTPYENFSKLREKAILEFGLKLKELRNKAGLSQIQIARQLKINPGYISKLENGKMPPPSMKVLPNLAKILHVKRSKLLYLAGKIQHSPEKNEKVGTMFGNIYRSIKRNMNVPKLSPLTNKGWVRVAISVLLVVSIAGGLWLASPSPVEAVTVSFPSTPAGTQGSSHSFQVRVDVTGVSDLLPVQSIDLYVNDQTNAYSFYLTGLPLSATTTTFSPSGVGTVSVTATPGSNWAYATSGATTHIGYGYGYTTGSWGYPSYGVSGYGYGYIGGVTGDTYIVFTVTWTPPSAWPTGTYYTNAVVHGNGSPTTSLTSPTPGSFTISAAAPAPAPAPVIAGEPPPTPTTESVADVIDEDGVFTSLFRMESEDGNVHLFIPRGTTGLTEEGEPLSEIEITEVRPAPAPPAGTSFLGLPYDLGPSGATFDPSILLTFEYNPAWIPAGADHENLTIAYYDEDAGRWVELDAADIDVDPATNTITCSISHFTYFAVLVRVAPASFEVSGLQISPTEADVAEKVNISVTVANTGDLAGSYEVVLKINGQVVSYKKVSVAGGDSEQVTFTTVQGKAGSYSVSIDGLSGKFTIKAPPIEPVVITSTVPSVTAPAVEYPAPTAPAPPVVPAPIPAPTPWLAIILSLVVTGIVAGILVWYYGFRREY